MTMATENFSTSSNISTESVEIDLSAAFTPGDQYTTGGVVYSSSLSKFISSVDNVPVGIVRMWANGSASATPPEDYLICAGQTLSVSSYPKLHSVIGYRFGGSGDSFNLPDFNITSGNTYRVPSGVDESATESDELNNVNSISIGANEAIAHTHNISTFTHTSNTGNSANTSHSHANMNSDATAHEHNFETNSITTNAAHSHNFGNASANHQHTATFSGNTTGVATGNPSQQHSHGGGGTVGNHAHTTSTAQHSHGSGNPTFNAGGSHSHPLTITWPDSTTSHSHDLSTTATYFIIKYR